ncbi:MAG: hypothetical protein Q4D98_09655 [Planctomycetia bacterium]|nr:hypothetical protein [Planctomycetia bacterium]
MAESENRKTILRWVALAVLLALAVGSVSIFCCTHSEPRTLEALCERPFNADEQMKIRFALADAGLNDYAFENGLLRVPVCRREMYLQTLSRADVFVEDVLAGKGGSLSIWRSEKERQEASLREKQDVLSRQVRGFNGMDAACVLLDVSETKKGFSRIRTVTASVTIRSQAGYIVSANDIAAIRMFVAGAVAGLTPENVAIVDTRTNRSWTVGTPIPAVGSVAIPVTCGEEKPRQIRVHPLEPTYGDVPDLVDDAAFDMLGKADSATATEVYKPVTEVVPVKKNDRAEGVFPALMGVLLAVAMVLVGIGATVWSVRRPRKKRQVVINILEETEKTTSPVAASGTVPPGTVPPDTEKPVVCESENLLSGLESEPEPPSEPVVEEKPAERVVEKRGEPPTWESVELRQIRFTAADVLARVLEEERSQTIALVLAQLREEQVSEVLEYFDETLRDEVRSRLAAYEETDEEIVREVLETVVERLDQDACRELPPVYEVSVRKYRIDFPESEGERVPEPEPFVPKLEWDGLSRASDGSLRQA